MDSRILVFISLFAVACSPKPPERPGAANAMAWVNGVPITHEDLQVALAARQGGETENKAAATQGALETAIRLELERQKAVALGLDKLPEVKQRLAMADAQYMTALRNVLADVYVTKSLLPEAKVPDAEVQKYVEAHPDEVRMEYHLQQVRYKNQEEAEAAKALLDAGKPFEDVAAMAYPGIPANGPKPWDPITVRWVQMPPEVRDAVSKLEPGQVSPVVMAGEKRFWIYKVVSKEPAKESDPAAEKQALSGLLQQQRLFDLEKQNFDELRKSATIKYGTKP